jgi:hypothetical protein
MRVNLFAALIPVVAACGGGKNDTPVIIDSAPDIDEPTPVAVCPVTPNLGEGGLFLLDPGADDMVGTADDGPLGNVCGASGTDPCNFYNDPAMTMGPNAGKKVFFLLAGLPPTADADPATTDDNLLGVELVSTNGAFVPGQTVNLTTSPSAIAGSQVFQMGTESYDAIAYVIGNVNAQGNFTHLYTSSSGSITPEEQGTTADSIIKGAVAATNLVETDGVAAVAGGCTTTLDGLTYHLTQGTASFQSTSPTSGSKIADARARNIYLNILRKTGRL